MENNDIKYENCILNEYICFWHRMTKKWCIKCALLAITFNVKNNDQINDENAKNNFIDIIKLLPVKVIFNQNFSVYPLTSILRWKIDS